MIPRPLGPRLLVKLLEEETRIWLPPGVTSTLRGAIVAVGTDVRYIEVADEILFNESESWEIRFEDEKLFVIHESSVLLLLDRVEEHSRQ